MPNQKITGLKTLGLICLSSILFCAGWHQGFTFFFLSVAFVPLLFFEDAFQHKQLSHASVLYLYTFVAFLLFISCTTYWLAQYSIFGALTVWIIQAALWALVFTAFHLTKKRFGSQVGYLAFVAYFMAFEYYNLCVGWGWAWTNLGNGLAAFTKGIQWYQFTGIAGGSLWILILNMGVYELIKKRYLKQPDFKKQSIALMALFILPIGWSYTLLWHFQFPTKSIKDSVAILQPNINSYEYKLAAFNKENIENQIKYILPLLNEMGKQNYDLIVLPETVFPYVANIDSSFHHPTQFLKPYLQNEGKLVFGMYLTNKKKQKYNAAVGVDKNDNYEYHLKNRLVPGVEYLPLYKAGKKAFHKKYYTQPDNQILNDKNLSYPTAICYESVFGADVAKQSLNKNKAILILTNDGWFDNTSLIQQHLNIAKLRAIENRRYVVRAANSGISCVINHYGEVVKSLPNKEAGIVKYAVPKAFHQTTFYQKYPDILYRIFALLAIILLLYTLVANYTHNFKFKKLGIR